MRREVLEKVEKWAFSLKKEEIENILAILQCIAKSIKPDVEVEFWRGFFAGLISKEGEEK